jgi:hypothetical protein
MTYYLYGKFSFPSHGVTASIKPWHLYRNGSPDLCSMKQQDYLNNTAAIFSQDNSKQD